MIAEASSTGGVDRCGVVLAKVNKQDYGSEGNMRVPSAGVLSVEPCCLLENSRYRSKVEVQVSGDCEWSVGGSEGRCMLLWARSKDKQRLCTHHLRDVIAIDQ